jgi:imidazoleglycerol-phosphate dehydratase
LPADQTLETSMSTARTATVRRDTQETRIEVTVNLDGTGQADLRTGLPFFEHMLTQISRHGLVDVTIHADRDLEVDAHHTV